MSCEDDRFYVRSRSSALSNGGGVGADKRVDSDASRSSAVELPSPSSGAPQRPPEKGALKQTADVLHRVLRRFVRDHFTPIAREWAVTPAPPARSAVQNRGLSAAPPARLRVLTQNLWALPIYPDLDDRVKGFCRVLEAGEWDVVVMQELQTKREVNTLVAAGARGGLAFHHHFIQGTGFPIWLDVMGTGLLVLSRYPITDAMYRRYSVNGFPHKLHHCDFYSAKGLGLVRLALPGALGVDVFLTHVHAHYGNAGPPPSGSVAACGTQVRWDSGSKDPLAGDEYAGHRAAQAFEAAKFIGAARNPANMCVLAGDLNMLASSPGATMVRCLAGRLRDSYREDPRHRDDDGFTVDAPDNVYTPAKSPEPPTRIDFVLWSPPSVAPASGEWFVEESDVQRFVVDTASGRRTHVSDHFGVGTTFGFARADDAGRLALARSRPVSCRSDPAVDCAAVAEMQRVVAAGVADAAKRQYYRQVRALVAVVALVLMLWAMASGSLTTEYTGWLGGVVQGPLLVFLPAYAVAELIIAQFAVKDERFAMQEVLSQMGITYNALRAGYL